MGAAVVVEAAALLGSNVRRVIALDGLSYLNVYPRQDEASVDGFVSPFVANFREAINHFVNMAMPGSDETLKRHVATVMKSGPSQHRVPMLAELLRWDMDSALDRLVAQISVLAARQFLSAELEIRYGKRFEIIPTDLGGHFFFMEQPSASAEMLESLLRR